MIKITEERKKFLLDLAKDAGMDVAVFYGLPWLKKQFGRSITADDRKVVAEVRDHLRKGETAEAQKLLVRHMMGWGLYDEQVFDEDLTAVVRAGLATTDEVLALQSWLAGDTPEKRRLRSRFRNSLTLQETPRSRMEVIASYAKLSSDAERDVRMQATGKLDAEFDEAVWNWVRTKVPGMTRSAWDAIYNGASTLTNGMVGGTRGLGATVGSGARVVGNGIVATGVAVRNGAVAANNELNAWGLALQAAHPAPPARVRSGLVQWLMDRIR